MSSYQALFLAALYIHHTPDWHRVQGCVGTEYLAPWPIPRHFGTIGTQAEILGIVVMGCNFVAGVGSEHYELNKVWICVILNEILNVKQVNIARDFKLTQIGIC